MQWYDFAGKFLAMHYSVCVVDPLLPGVNVMFHGCLYVLIMGNAKNRGKSGFTHEMVITIPYMLHNNN